MMSGRFVGSRPREEQADKPISVVAGIGKPYVREDLSAGLPNLISKRTRALS
jgi:hypothetical protein